MKKRIRLGGSGASTGAIYLTLVRVVTILLGFVISRLLSQYLTKYEYGTYSQITLLISTVSSLTILGMMDAVNFFFCKEPDPERREKCIATIFSLQYIVGISAGALMLLLAGILGDYFKNDGIRPLIYIAAAIPLLQNVMSMLQVLFISIGKSKSIAMRNLICSVIRLAVVYVASVWLKSVALIVATTLVLDIGQIVYFTAVLHRNNCRIRLNRTDFSMAKEILSYSVPMAAFTVISSLSRDMDKYVISTFMNTESLAVYSNASKVLPFDIIMSSFITVLLPYITGFIAQKRYEEARTLYQRFLQLSYISTAIMAVAVLVSAPEVMTLLYTEKYLDGLGVFCAYILVDILRFTNITLVLSASGNTKTVMNISIFGLGLNFILNLACYRLFGFIGPAIATLAVIAVTGGLILRCSARAMETTLAQLFDLGHLLLFLGECVGIGLVCHGLRCFLVSLGLPYFLVLGIASGIFGVILGLLNFRKLLSILKAIEATKLVTLEHK